MTPLESTFSLDINTKLDEYVVPIQSVLILCSQFVTSLLTLVENLVNCKATLILQTANWWFPTM